MRELIKEHFFRALELWKVYGFGMKICCAILLGTILMFPDHGYGQALYGDPSSTLGQWGKFKLEVGVGVIDNPNFKINGKPISVTYQGQSYNLIASDTSVNIRSKQLFLTATLGLGSSIDALLKVGRFKTQDPFDGNYGPSGGLGFRFSPPQTGLLKMGLLFQAFYATSKNNDFGSSIDTSFEPDAKGLKRHIDASGTADDKLRLISYDILLGFGVQDIPFVRPYSALLVSIQNRTEKGSFSGRGNVTTCVANSCLGGVVPVSLSWNTDVSSDSIIGGVFGLSMRPIERAGINLEGFLGAGHLGSQYGFTASAFINF